MRDNTQAALDQIEAYVRFLRVEVPAAIELLNWYTPDGLAAHPTDGGGTHTKGAHESPIERILLQRGDYDEEGEWGATSYVRQLESIGDELDGAAKTLRNLLDECRTTRRKLANKKVAPRDGEPARCDGGAGRQGFLIPRNEGGWSHPDCGNVPDAGRHTCTRCRQASSRWARSTKEDAA